MTISTLTLEEIAAGSLATYAPTGDADTLALIAQLAAIIVAQQAAVLTPPAQAVFPGV